MLTSTKLRQHFLDFFVDKGHSVIPSASLVPANDPTVLFTTAGMHPLVPNLLGAPHPAGTRLANVQKCVRTGDIDEIGDDTHLTMFEMLGNWSLGDYGKREAIAWTHEFLTRVLGVPLERLAVTCYTGDDDAVGLWLGHGISRERLAELGRDDNWWGPAGATGPCGPDTEVFYWVGDAPAPAMFDPSDRSWVEIWNNVFMSFTQAADRSLSTLARANVDTGMGLERVLFALNGLRSVYDVDTVAPIHRELAAMTTGNVRIVTDHLRAATFLISDGVAPGNKDRGYVVRRLLRGCLVEARRLALPADWYRRGVPRVLECLGDAYPELRADPVIAAIDDELARFTRAIATGERALRSVRTLDGAVAFDLFQTHGIPFELTLELARTSGIAINRDAFDAARTRHADRSRTTSAGAFAGGLADHSTEIVRYHTLTHLLLAALRDVLGPHVIQRGSNLTHERLRFDFSHPRRVEPHELARVTELVNGWLARGVSVERTTMREPDARALGALGAFGEKYGDVVSVYTLRAGREIVSRELCGGPHVEDSPRGELQIVREQAVSDGVRRIKAVFAPDPP